MPNALYDKGREKFLTGAINWASDNIKVAAVKAGYVRNLATDEFLSVIAGADIVATSGNLTGKTTTAGVADAADFTYPTVAAGPAITQLVIYKDTGVAATSPLIGNIDTATNLPKTPDGTNIDVVWDNGANKIFKL